MWQRVSLVLLAVLSLVVVVVQRRASEPRADRPGAAPLATSWRGGAFIANEGQEAAPVAFSVALPEADVFVTRDGALVHSLHRDGRGWTLVERLGAPVAEVRGLVTAPARVTHFLATDDARTRAASPTWAVLSLGEPWPGIGVELVASPRGVERRFTLAPGADTRALAISLEGADALALDDDGQLVATTGLGAVRFSRPVAWQEQAGARRPVSVAWAPRGDARGFALGSHEPTAAVIIDPLLHATFLGGMRDDVVWELARAPNGDLYAAGATESADFPGTTGGAQPAHGSAARLRADAFVARFTPSLQLVQATFLGGDDVDSALGVVVEPTSGDVLITGFTRSQNFPGTSGGLQPTIAADEWDAFLARFDASLTTLRQATYLGGTQEDDGAALALHPTTGEVYVQGWTLSTNFPGTSGGAQSTNTGNGFQWDAFIARLSPDLKALHQATYFGGGLSDFPEAFAVTDAGVFLAGWTDSKDLPGTGGGAQADAGGARYDGFVVKLDAPLTHLVQATYLGGTDDDFVVALAVHPGTGEVYVGGNSLSADYPGTTGGAQPLFTRDGGREAMISRLTPELTQLVQSTWLGGASDDLIVALGISQSPAAVFAAGHTSSLLFPATTGGALPNLNGAYDAFVARLSPELQSLTQSTFLGGSANDFTNAMVLGGGRVYVGGVTTAVDFPVTPDAGQPVRGGADDGFVAAFDLSLRRTGVSTADLALTKSASASPMAGEPMTWTLTVENLGPEPASGVRVSDTLPAGAAFVSATASQGTCAGEAIVTCELGALAVNARATVLVVVRPSSAGTSTNIASVSGDSLDPSSLNDQATAHATVAQPTADLALEKRVAGGGSVADKVTFTLTVTNHGPATATNVVLTDPLVGVEPVDRQTSQGSCEEEGLTITCALGTLAPQATAQVTLEGRLTTSGSLTNTATVHGAEPDPLEANNSASATVEVAACGCSAGPVGLLALGVALVLRRRVR